MFSGNSTAAEAAAIQTDRIAGTAQSRILANAPRISAMREAGVTGQPIPSEPAQAVDLDENGEPVQYWRVGMVPGALPIKPGK